MFQTIRDYLVGFALIVAYLFYVFRGPPDAPLREVRAGEPYQYELFASAPFPYPHVNYPTYPRGGWVRREGQQTSRNARVITRRSVRAYSSGSSGEDAKALHCEWAVTPCGRTTHVRAWGDTH